MNIFVTGANGQLGSELSKLQSNYPDWNFIFTDIPEINICDRQQIEKKVIDDKITAIINCAAYTAVDKAESEPEICEKVNKEGPKVLAEVSAKYNLKFIHVSTDFVFDGRNFKPYQEDDMPNPLSVYGKTKLEGEKEVLAANPNIIIIRTSWLYSATGNNFVKTMRRLGSNLNELKVIYDQTGTPTWAFDLARTILHIISDPDSFTHKKGLFHYSNEGVTSWYDFAFEIMEISKLNCNLIPIVTEEYPTPAKRPHYSVMDKSKIKQTFGISIPYWKDSLKECIKELDKNDSNIKR